MRRPQIVETHDEVIVSAGVQLETPVADAPDAVYFAYPKAYRDVVTDRSDGFAVALLPIAMLLGERLDIEGTVSPRLAFGLREYQQVRCKWWPGILSIIETTYGELAEAPDDGANKAVGTTLSGGVDSLYAILKHTPRNEPLESHRLTHAMIINGFDFDTYLDDAEPFERILAFYTPFLERQGLELLAVRSNLRTLRMATRGRSRLIHSLESPIAAAVLVAGKLFSRFYIPGSSSYHYEALIPKGAHPVVVPMLETEHVQLIADGYEASRTQKTVALSEWEETYELLRVCWRPVIFNEQSGRVENCCYCEKCVRTMLALDILGVLHKYKTFPLPLKRKSVWGTRYFGRASMVFYRENLALARRHGRGDRVLDMQLARLRSRLLALTGKRR